MYRKNLMLIITVLLLTLFSSSALAGETREEPSVVIKILDLVIIRPISVGVATASTALCIGISPLAYLIGVGEPTARVLVEAPWRFTGMRYLGDFEHYKDGRPITVVN